MTNAMGFVIMVAIILAIALVGAVWENHLQRKKVGILMDAYKEEERLVSKWRDEAYRIRLALLKLAFPSSVTTSHEIREELKKIIGEI